MAASAQPAAKTSREKRDDDIMLTNDSSIVSKRSVKKLYHPNDPDFFRPFTAKFQRRSPLINRGYWLRMKAIEVTVKRFLEEQNGKEKIVVNLGCGYDPLPFEFSHRYPDLIQSAHFVDVDYPPLMQKKRACILQDEELQRTFPDLARGEAKGANVWRAGRYIAVGCDLRQLSELQQILENEVQIHDCAVLFIAEVSVAYMDVESADAVVAWASTFEDSRFCILEQCLPDGPEHPFASTMLSHFQKLHTHLRVCHQYPTLEAQKSRFLRNGWGGVEVNSLWDVWSHEDFVSSDERLSLDSCEPFDEWEEFALFASHYLLLVARTQCFPKSEGDYSGFTAEHAQESDQWELGFHNMGESNCRRFSAVCRTNLGTVLNHGGYGAQNRLQDYEFINSAGSVKTFATSPLALMCHTITPIGDEQCLLIGGRASPNRPSAECWLFKDNAWERLEDSPFPRYRHCAVSVELKKPGGTIKAVLVFGGKTGTEVLQQPGQWMLWSRERGWESCLSTSPNKRDDPQPRFGAAMAMTSTTSGIIMGGMSADGVILDDLWSWRLVEVDGETRIAFNPQQIRASCSSGIHKRFGANLIPCGADGFLLVGGVARNNLLRRDEEVLHIELTHPVKVSKVPAVYHHCPRPLFVGAGVAPISEDRTLLTGGGAVCFSMGSFWNNTNYSLQIRKRQINRIPRIQISTPADFAALVAAGKPAILTSLDLGPCTTLWNPPYLIEKVGTDRPIIVHSSPTSRMTFATKNFSYHKQPFAEFLSAAVSGSQLYLRALASTQPAKHPANLWRDFPALGPDFRIPPPLAEVQEKMHSAPLRISGPVALWLHYDVLANILCQIAGTKTLRLFSPRDVKHLSYAPGASSSNLDVFDPATASGLAAKGCVPWDAALGPGDVLFIPPAWSHAARPEAGLSVAVNAFWRNLAPGAYAVGRDVYGNRDLGAYEEGRKGLERLVKGFEDVPGDLREFYLERLVGELRGLVDGVVAGDGEGGGERTE